MSRRLIVFPWDPRHAYWVEHLLGRVVRVAVPSEHRARFGDEVELESRWHAFGGLRRRVYADPGVDLSDVTELREFTAPPCTEHDDCRMNADLGRACRERRG